MATHDQHGGHKRSSPANYRQLLIMTLLSFISMYVLMFAMADVLANVIPRHR